MTYERLKLAYRQADKIDRSEGLIAYQRYHDLMQSIADKYSSTLYRVITVFVSLSPNSSYHHNLRGAVSVLKAIRDGVPLDHVTVATYRHCLMRAWAYGTGAEDFFAKTRGPKIINFFHNIMNPADTRWVTIDGHMSALWQGQALTMREALVSLRMYRMIADDTKRLAFEEFILPQQMQATLWFVRKRLLNIGFDPQTDILQLGDQWRTARNADDIEPYPWRPVRPANVAKRSIRTSDIRKPTEGTGALRGLVLSGLRDSRRDRLRVGGSMAMEQAVFAWETPLVSAPRGDGSDRQGLEGPQRQARSEQADGKPVLASGHNGADGSAEAVTAAYRRSSGRRSDELPPQQPSLDHVESEHESSAIERQAQGFPYRAREIET